MNLYRSIGGWFQDEAGRSDCKRCVNGTYVNPRRAPGKMAQDCRVCPTGTNTSLHAGHRACRCLEGHYRLDRFGPCYACNATSPGLRCVHESASIKEGFWWSWAETEKMMEERYVQYTRYLTFDNISYPNVSVTYNGSLPKVYKCPLESSCKGGISSEEMCAAGYDGPLCAVCKSGYYNWFNTCQSCSQKWRIALQLAVTILIFLLLLFVFYWLDRFHSRHKRATTLLLDRIAAKAKIIVGLVQVMSDVISALSYIPWPDALLQVGSKLKVFGMNLVEFTNLSCLSEKLRMSAIVKPIFSVGLQTVLIVSILSYYTLRHRLIPKLLPRFSVGRKQLSLARRSCFRNSWWLLFLCYPTTAAYVIATLPYRDMTCIELCQYEGEKHCQWKLRTDLAVECDYNQHRLVLWIFCWSLVTYVIALPLLAAWALFKRHRLKQCVSRLHADELHFEESMTASREAKDDLMDSLQFLDENYQARFWYWELTEVVRKLLLTCGVQYFGNSSLSGVAIAAIIANLFLMLHAQFKPIKRRSEHWMQLISLLIVSSNLMMGTLIALQEANSSEESRTTDYVVFSVIVLLVNASFVLYLTG